PHAGASACIVPDLPGTREAGPEFQVGEPVREEGRQEGEEGQEGQEEDVIRVAAGRPPGESCDSIEGKRATRNPELAVESCATPRGVLPDANPQQSLGGSNAPLFFCPLSGTVPHFANCSGAT